MTVPYEYSFQRSPEVFTVRKGVLRIGNQVIPIAYAESYRTNMRVALSLLYWYFDGEPQAERKAFALHYQLGRRLTITEGWTMTPADLDETVLDILLCGQRCELQIMGAERRDQIRQLAHSESTFSRRVHGIQAKHE
jgi:hypothetical protein